MASFGAGGSPPLMALLIRGAISALLSLPTKSYFPETETGFAETGSNVGIIFSDGALS
jgi:hypothetical protein